jgi:hypothetical protein
MRKLLSIQLAVLILFSGLTVNIATHYCGGNPVATKVSLSGELATCGMEKATSEIPSQKSLKNHCCDNVISAYSLNNNFVPSYLLLSLLQHQNIEVHYPAIINSALNDNFKIISDEIIRPPGIFYNSQASQEILCIFRI